jgi:hypothetical protein
MLYCLLDFSDIKLKFESFLFFPILKFLDRIVDKPFQIAIDVSDDQLFEIIREIVYVCM